MKIKVTLTEEASCKDEGEAAVQTLGVEAAGEASRPPRHVCGYTLLVA